MSQVDNIDLKILDALQESGKINLKGLVQTVGHLVISIRESLWKGNNLGNISPCFDSKMLRKDITALVFFI